MKLKIRIRTILFYSLLAGIFWLGFYSVDFFENKEAFSQPACSNIYSGRAVGGGCCLVTGGTLTDRRWGLASSICHPGGYFGCSAGQYRITGIDTDPPIDYVCGMCIIPWTP